MPEIEKLKNILLVGAGGNTGKWYLNLMISKGHYVFAYDSNPRYQVSSSLKGKGEIVSQSDFESAEILNKTDGITLSPGVPLKQSIFAEAAKKNIPVFSEAEYCMPYLENKKMICVTGTDGKSTVTALVTHLLSEKESVSCGNFGVPFSEVVLEEEKYANIKTLTAELSSYQLELFRNIRCDCAIFLNIADDHLNRYKNKEEYEQAKWNIIRNASENDLLIVNKNLLENKEKKIMADIIAVDCENIKSKNFYWKDEYLLNSNNQKLLQKNDLHIQGRHNLSNILFSLEAVKKINTGLKLETIVSRLKNFQGLKHRFEIIKSNDENIYINDSKATTGQAVMKALENVSSHIFLFMGGQSKHENYENLGQKIKEKNAAVFLFGKDKNELKESFQKKDIFIAGSFESLDDAFYAAKKYQKKENIKSAVYLLSPAMTSWDSYKNFEERGEHFRRLVLSSSHI